MSPAIIALVLGTGLLALLPTRRLARRTTDRWVATTYYLILWFLLVLLVATPALARYLVPLAILLAIAPFVTPRAGLGRLLGRTPREPRRPPRNVTPPDAR